MTFKDLIKTTEGAVVIIGLLLTVISPFFSPRVWALLTGITYVLINLPGLWVKIKEWINNLNSGNTD